MPIGNREGGKRYVFLATSPFVWFPVLLLVLFLIATLLYEPARALMM
jgi:hypothetical protein